jgi:hypothetical protein
MAAPVHSFAHRAVRSNVVAEFKRISQVRACMKAASRLRKAGLRHGPASRVV